MGCSLYLNLRRAHVGIERCVDCLTYERPFFLQFEVLKEHGYGENLSQGVGDVQSFALGPRTVDGLKDRCACTGGGAGQQAHRTGYAGAFVREDIAEGVLCDHHIEELRVLNHAHGSIIYIHEIGLHIGVLGHHLLGYLAPQAA